MSNELRKTYLRNELKNNKMKCVPINRLIDINEQFGTVTESKFSINTDPEELKRRIIMLLGDPFTAKYDSRSTSRVRQYTT